ncbi:MAG TPA: UbiA family prenyltransferase [Methylomirabilota bacterium]|nr:UbiA family prenyltransferase [Methylomirabilota bacterium]
MQAASRNGLPGNSNPGSDGAATPQGGDPGWRRWWIYQRERFPVFAHGPLILAFSFSAVSFSSLLRGDVTFPDGASLTVAFVTSFLFFLQLRIADEFKDADEDARFRPYRPVPRGLVSLRELGWVFAGAALLQLLLAWLLAPGLVVVLSVAWTYLALMSREFFARRWLKARPVTYLWTHMLILPLVDLHATACDWLPAGRVAPPEGLIWFLVVSFLNGVVIEFGRKLRAPRDEEPGVETYTFLWGPHAAVSVWWIALLATGLTAWLAARRIDFAIPVTILMVVLLLFAALIAWRFLKQPNFSRAKMFETFSAVWTLLMYLQLGTLPLLLCLAQAP